MDGLSGIETTPGVGIAGQFIGSDAVGIDFMNDGGVGGSDVSCRLENPTVPAARKLVCYKD